MNKEKEIERMVQIAYNYSKEFANTPYYKGVYTDMESVCEAGYRKADEVRKETAKEILQDLYDGVINATYVIMTRNSVKRFAEKYGVEVDE